MDRKKNVRVIRTLYKKAKETNIPANIIKHPFFTGIKLSSLIKLNEKDIEYLKKVSKILVTHQPSLNYEYIVTLRNLGNDYQ